MCKLGLLDILSNHSLTSIENVCFFINIICVMYYNNNIFRKNLVVKCFLSVRLHQKFLLLINIHEITLMLAGFEKDLKFWAGCCL